MPQVLTALSFKLLPARLLPAQLVTQVCSNTYKTRTCCKQQDGSAVAARIVVGADGLLSPVRQAWLQDGGPEFDGRVILR